MRTYGILHKITGQSARILHWVALAIGEAFSNMNGIHIEDGVAIATDGKRLHMAPVPKVEHEESGEESPILADGDYAVITSKSNIIHLAEIVDVVKPFPEWKRIIPLSFPTKTGTYLALSSKKASGFSLEVAKLFEFCEYKSPVNHDFLSDLSELNPGVGYQVELRKNDYDTRLPLIFRQGEAVAVIMPMNMES